jgi:flavin reductase (DIM6/NTAB) family NADH-FMN oxidoreductase RutF
VGTINSKGITNVAIFNSVVHIGANPPRIGFIHRPPTVPKQTFENIRESGEYTINLVTEAMIPAAHQTSARYEPGVSEFDQTDLNPEFADGLAAPFVKESPVKFGMRLEEIVPIPCNGTLLIIGNVESIRLPEEIIGNDGHVNLAKLGITGVVGLDHYHRVEPITRMAYAKPDLPPREID